MPIRQNRYNDPALGAAFENIASMFAPPSAADTAAYATAQATREKAARLAQLFDNPEDPHFDRRNIAVGNYNPTQSFYAQDQNTETTRRGQDITAQTSIANNAADNQRSVVTSMFGPLGPGEIRPELPGEIAGQFGLPALAQVSGMAPVLSETQWQAGQNERLRQDGMITDEMILESALGERAPVQAVGPDGNPMFMSPGAAVRQGAQPAQPVGGRSAAEDQIARLSQQFIDTGLTGDAAEARNLAIGIVDNRYTVSRHPVTGEALVLDVATGRPVSRGGTGSVDPGEGAPEISPPGEMPFGQRFSNSPEAFGVGGALTGGINSVFDALGVGAPYPEVQQTQSDFAVLRESLLNDIGSAYNRQPPSWLLRNIEALTPRAGSALEGAGTAQSKLTAIGRQLSDELRTTQETLQGELSPANRQEVETRVIGLRAAIGRVADALNSFGGEVSPQTPSTGGPQVPEGATATNPETGARIIFRNGAWEPLQ
ncbi:hypothetical protein EMQ25_00795 [Arsenicitalea aurantiaca]|uniref:Uncharacterized protein n=1 Tax=Arsenicitalea aurantiaca TaxID=1783274 RepID=A0A433XKF3_9HYPH|nr:hypothetical protein [Arsenicitalea aurantiaca]RUT34533.1 hypothetical protein EMQ25_00795 [Arsenicitalea aurantiaca]